MKPYSVKPRDGSLSAAVASVIAVFSVAHCSAGRLERSTVTAPQSLEHTRQPTNPAGSATDGGAVDPSGGGAAASTVGTAAASAPGDSEELPFDRMRAQLVAEVAAGTLDYARLCQPVSDRSRLVAGSVKYVCRLQAEPSLALVFSQGDALYDEVLYEHQALRLIQSKTAELGHPIEVVPFDHQAPISLPCYQWATGTTAGGRPMCVGFLEKWMGPSEYVFFGGVGPSSVGLSARIESAQLEPHALERTCVAIANHIWLAEHGYYFWDFQGFLAIASTNRGELRVADSAGFLQLDEVKAMAKMEWVLSNLDDQLTALQAFAKRWCKGAARAPLP